MEQALQKQISEALTFATQPKEYVTELSQLLITLQDAYRSKLSEAEQQLWVSTLSAVEEQFSMQEIHAAVTEMIKNPPLYEVPGPDGPVTQKWRGMPKLPDLIETMLSLRSKSVREAFRQRETKRHEEHQQLEKRRAEHPEEFFGLADVLKGFKEKIPDIQISRDKDGVEAPAICGMPEVHLAPTGEIDRYGLPEMKEVSPILASEEAMEYRRRQMKREFDEHETKKAAK